MRHHCLFTKAVQSHPDLAGSSAQPQLQRKLHLPGSLCSRTPAPSHTQGYELHLEGQGRPRWAST